MDSESSDCRKGVPNPKNALFPIVKLNPPLFENSCGLSVTGKKLSFPYSQPFRFVASKKMNPFPFKENPVLNAEGPPGVKPHCVHFPLVKFNLYTASVGAEDA